MYRTYNFLMLASLVGNGMAMERQQIGPRAVAMGGANVVCAEASTLLWANPALLAVPDPDGDVAGGFDVESGLVVIGDLAAALEAWQDIQLFEIANAPELSEEQIRQLALLIGDLARIDVDSVGLNADASTGIGMRIGRWGFGVRAFGDGTGFISDIDLANLGIGGGGVVNTSFENNAEEILGQPPAGYTVQQLTPAQVAELQAGGFSADAIAVADHYAVNLSDRDRFDADAQERYVDGLVSANSGVTSLDDNGTAVQLGSLMAIEIPLSYGFSITPEFSVGVTMKAMYGRVYGPNVSAYDSEASGLFPSFKGGHEDTWTYGIDAGALWQMPHWSLGLTGRNLNRPTFNGFNQVKEIAVDPGLVFGAGWRPSKSLEVQAAVDVFEHERLLSDVEDRYLGLGVDWRVIKPLSLRAGVSSNVQGQSSEEVDPVVSGGFGAWMGPVHIDFALAVATSSEEYQDQSIPRVLRAALGIGAAF